MRVTFPLIVPAASHDGRLGTSTEQHKFIRLRRKLTCSADNSVLPILVTAVGFSSCDLPLAFDLGTRAVKRGGGATSTGADVFSSACCDANGGCSGS